MNRVALDTNIVLRIAVPAHPLHAETLAAVEKLRRDGRQIVLFPQIVYEFWAVGTKTVVANGLGFVPSIVDGLIENFTAWMPLVHDNQAVYDRWRLMAKQYAVAGVNSYDMRIAAAMLTHGIPTLLTRNAGDFSRFAGIDVLTPEMVLASVSDG